jgi:transcription elongation GreA/GreB family factor
MERSCTAAARRARPRRPLAGFLPPAGPSRYRFAMDKRFLLAQLTEHLQTAARTARLAMQAAVSEARDGATPAEKRDDARVAQENAGLARGHRARLDRITAEIAALEKLELPPSTRRQRAALGTIVEVEDGDEGRTFFLAPVGAGVELTGPGGDGILSVVTPSSPIGRAVLGRSVGDTLEVVVKGEGREWTVTCVE